MKLTICGAAGGIGQPLSLLMKLQLPNGSHLALYDIVNIAGVAADLSHINTGVKLTSHQGPDTLEAALQDADIVLIPAGVPRKPNMTRDDLFNINAGIVKTLVEAVSRACPKAFLCIITNPVNSTVPIAAEVLKKAGCFNPARLFGVTTLDCVRSNTFVSEAKNLDVTKLQVRCVGGHSGETILPLLSQVEGTAWEEEEQRKMIYRIQNAGTEVVEAKAGAGSATLSMAHAAASFVASLIRALNGEKGVVECSYVKVEGEKTEYFSYPIELGAHGIEKILPIGALNNVEQEILDKMIEMLQANIKKGVEFASKL